MLQVIFLWFSGLISKLDLSRVGTERCRISTSHVVADANEPGLFLFCCILRRLLLVVFSFCLFIFVPAIFLVALQWT